MAEASKDGKPAAGKRTIYMRADVWQAVVDIAAAEHMSVSAWITRAVKRAIHNRYHEWAVEGADRDLARKLERGAK